MKPNKDEPIEIDPLEDLLPDKNKRRNRRNNHRKYDSREFGYKQSVPPWRKRKGHRGDYEDTIDYEDD